MFSVIQSPCWCLAGFLRIASLPLLAFPGGSTALAAGFCSWGTCCFGRLLSIFVTFFLGELPTVYMGGGRPRPGSPLLSCPLPITALFLCLVLSACCELLLVPRLLLPAVCCCIALLALALRSVRGLGSTAFPPFCLPSVLAEAAIAGELGFSAPYITCYSPSYLVADQGAVRSRQH